MPEKIQLLLSPLSDHLQKHEGSLSALSEWDSQWNTHLEHVVRASFQELENRKFYGKIRSAWQALEIFLDHPLDHWHKNSVISTVKSLRTAERSLFQLGKMKKQDSSIALLGASMLGEYKYALMKRLDNPESGYDVEKVHRELAYITFSAAAEHKFGTSLADHCIRNPFMYLALENAETALGFALKSDRMVPPLLSCISKYAYDLALLEGSYDGLMEKAMTFGKLRLEYPVAASAIDCARTIDAHAMYYIQNCSAFSQPQQEQLLLFIDRLATHLATMTGRYTPVTHRLVRMSLRASKTLAKNLPDSYFATELPGQLENVQNKLVRHDADIYKRKTEEATSDDPTDVL